MQHRPGALSGDRSGSAGMWQARNGQAGPFSFDQSGRTEREFPVSSCTLTKVTLIYWSSQLLRAHLSKPQTSFALTFTWNYNNNKKGEVDSLINESKTHV